MKRLLTLLTFVLCSCAETFVGEEIAKPNSENLPDLTAVFAEEDATRTYIEDGKYLRWNEDDRLTIFYGNTLNRQYKFNGATGDNSGTFSLVADGMLGTGNAFDHIYALYPYNADARITDEGVITLTLPETQSCAENSFGLGANTMVAVTENLEDTFLAFKNVGGYLKLKLYNAEGATIKSIEVKGNNGEKLAGEATLSINFGEAPILTMAESATDAITLDCGEGVALGSTAETATEFWVVLPATTFTEGLTITATDTEGKVFEKSTTNEVIIERNAIQPMAVLEAKFVATKPANNEIWYTNGSTTEATAPYKTNVFGANIVSNTYDAEKECWVIKFDGEVTTIGEQAFYNCSSLTSITIPDSVTTIGGNAFRGCSSLTSITIPDSVTTIGKQAFYGCTGELIVNCNIPSVSSSLHGTFYYSKFTSVIIGDSVTTIGNYAFYGCSGLTSVTIPDSVTTIGRSAFSGCESLTSITIPDGVTTIESGAFNGCSSLTSITIPDGVTIIGTEAFYKCRSLTSVTIPDSVTEINWRAFSDCYNLTSVTIPDSVTGIGAHAFAKCTSLMGVYCKAVTPPTTYLTIDDYSEFWDAFPSNCKIYVPYTSVVEYRNAANWIEYADDIVAYDFEIGEVANPNAKPANNEIWYKNGSTTEATTTNTKAFGANVISNTYDVEIGCWVIKCDGDVTTIGDYAFSGCSKLKSITTPDSATTIGYQAFSNCDSLTSVTIGNGVTTIGESAFWDCDSLTSVKIPDSVTTIGGRAFMYCVGLTSVTIPDSVTTIGEEAFSYCSSLTSITIPDSVTTLGSSAFSHCSDLKSITIPDSITTIAGHIFHDCSSLTSVTLPNSVTTIAGGAFSGCSKLKSITIPNSVTTIGERAFEDCSSLTSITIPGGVTTIDEFAFRFCTSLKSITIPDGVTAIGDYAFYYCSSLTSVTIPNNVTTIGGLAFYCCSSLTSVAIGDSVTKIGDYAFDGCSSLTSVTIPDSVTAIGEEAFSYCSSLTEFRGKYASEDGRCLIIDGTLNSFAPAGLTTYSIPDSVTTIGGNAFYGCSSLTSITIPGGVTTIGYRAFYNCKNLTSVYCKATTPPLLGADVFVYYENWSTINIDCDIYVPKESVEAYKSAEGWSEYASNIQSLPYTPTECTSLTITAEDVTGNDTTTTIYYVAETNGVDMDGANKSETITGTAQSDSFPQNPSTTESIERTITFTYLGQTATTKITQGPAVASYYTISTNDQWRLSTSVSNPDSSLYDGVYESYSNYNVNDGVATMYIDIDGYSEFSIYVRSNAESSYDYVTVSELDSTTQKMSTSGKQNSGTAISNYTKVTYSGIDGGSHRITVTYKKDYSQHSGTDRGYLIIPKNQ